MITKVKGVYVHGYGKVLYSDAAMREVFDRIVRLCFETQTFCGETACQSDEFLMKCQEVLPDIVDTIGFAIEEK